MSAPDMKILKAGQELAKTLAVGAKSVKDIVYAVAKAHEDSGGHQFIREPVRYSFPNGWHAELHLFPPDTESADTQEEEP